MLGLVDEECAEIVRKCREHGNVANLVEVIGLRAVVERLGSFVRTVDEIVEDDQIPRLVRFIQTTAGCGRHDHIAAGLTQCWITQ